MLPKNLSQPYGHFSIGSHFTVIIPSPVLRSVASRNRHRTQHLRAGNLRPTSRCLCTLGKLLSVKCPQQLLPTLLFAVGQRRCSRSSDDSSEPTEYIPCTQDKCVHAAVGDRYYLLTSYDQQGIFLEFEPFQSSFRFGLHSKLLGQFSNLRFRR